MRPTILVALLLMSLGTPARSDDLVVYGAGSLREALSEIAQTFAQTHQIAVSTQFGHSGTMRERIEQGEHADVFASADVGHPRKLVTDGRASIMAVFVRNTICVLSPAAFAATTDTLLDKLLAPGTRIGISPPKADPLGDYTLRLFNLIDSQRPGAVDTLQAHAVVLGQSQPGTAPKSGDNDADAILGGRIDVSIVYCSGRARYAHLLPTATLLPLPSGLQIGPEYALAVLKDAQPLAYAFALAILAPEGQKTLASYGFRPVTLPTD